MGCSHPFTRSGLINWILVHFENLILDGAPGVPVYQAAGQKIVCASFTTAISPNRPEKNIPVDTRL